jgi:hypothetical protein
MSSDGQIAPIYLNDRGWRSERDLLKLNRWCDPEHAPVERLPVRRDLPLHGTKHERARQRLRGGVV